MTIDLRRAPYAGWRALAASVLVMCGAVGAHTWAGGHVPDGSVLIALAALVYAASLLVLSGTATWRLLLPLVAAAQAGLHTTLTTTAVDHAGHGAGHLDAAEAATSWSWQMLAAHAGVTLLTALAWWLCSRAADVVVGLVRPAASLVLPRLRDLRAGGPTTPHTSVLLLAVAPRRGPPLPQLV